MPQQAFGNVAHVDIAIIGGGVAGSSLAIAMQRAGWSTAVIEREPVFRDRVRGEACHPWGVKELIALDLMPYFRQAGGVELPVWSRYRDREVALSFRWDEAFPGSPPEIGFNHPKLEETLLMGAAYAGALVFRPARPSIARRREGWAVNVTVDDTTTEIRSRFLVAADGKNSGTRKLWGGGTITDPPHHTMGGMLAENLALNPTVAYQARSDDAGFSMIFPQADDRWRVYLVGPLGMAQRFTGPDRVQCFLEACSLGLPEGALDSATPTGPLAFFPNSHVVTTRIDGPRAVAIGDAAGAADPTQGHGMALVWRDVRVLRDLLLSEDLDDVPSEYANSRRQYEHVLRTHAAWVAPLIAGEDEFSTALRAQVDAAREIDPDALGYSGIFANGPDNLLTDEAARSAFFGEHLTDNPVLPKIALDTVA